MALLGENGLAKDLGLPIDSSLFFFFYSPLPDKDQQSGCSIFSEDITGREKGGAKRLLFCFLYRSAARMAVYRRGPS